MPLSRESIKHSKRVQSWKYSNYYLKRSFNETSEGQTERPASFNGTCVSWMISGSTPRLNLINSMIFLLSEEILNLTQQKAVGFLDFNTEHNELWASTPQSHWNFWEYQHPFDWDRYYRSFLRVCEVKGQERLKFYWESIKLCMGRAQKSGFLIYLEFQKIESPDEQFLLLRPKPE